VGSQTGVSSWTTSNPGKPQQNAYIEQFSRTARYEWLPQYEWENLERVQAHATRWMWSYDHAPQI